MKTIQANFLREAAALLAFGGLLLCAPLAVRGEDTPVAQTPVRISLPAMRVGGIPRGQIMQITENGSELVAAAQITLAAANTAANTARAAPALERKPAPRLFCANTM